MEYFENTTRITKDGYAAILQMKRKQHHMVCRALGILLAIPFLERLIYNFILLCLKDRSDFHFGYSFYHSAVSGHMVLEPAKKADSGLYFSHQRQN